MSMAMRVFMNGDILRRVVVLMPMVPELGFVQQKEKHQAGLQQSKQLV